jgi:hypothetical protein
MLYNETHTTNLLIRFTEVMRIRIWVGRNHTITQEQREVYGPKNWFDVNYAK